MDPTSIKIFLLFHEGLPTASDCSVATGHAQRITVTAIRQPSPDSGSIARPQGPTTS